MQPYNQGKLMNKYIVYLVDTETDGLQTDANNVLELSLIRLNDGEQKTWWLKPLKPENIELGALRVNGHKLEDITWKTKIGREKYREPSEVLVEIENWIALDNCQAEDRILMAHNIVFDKTMLEQLWKNCNSKETFPFGRRSFDTGIIEFFIDWCKGDMAEGYSLKNLCKKYGIKNENAHTAAADTFAMKQIFEKQVEFFKKLLNK